MRRITTSQINIKPSELVDAVLYDHRNVLLYHGALEIGRATFFR